MRVVQKYRFHKKEENKGRRNVEIRKGRRKQSEKGILAGEQSIRKFLIQERKPSTPKRKFLEGSEEEENMLEGSHKKRRKIETGRNIGNHERNTVKGLLKYFDKEIMKQEENPSVRVKKEAKRKLEEKEENPDNNAGMYFYSQNRI